MDVVAAVVLAAAGALATQSLISITRARSEIHAWRSRHR